MYKIDYYHNEELIHTKEFNTKQDLEKEYLNGQYKMLIKNEWYRVIARCNYEIKVISWI